MTVFLGKYCLPRCIRMRKIYSCSERVFFSCSRPGLFRNRQPDIASPRQKVFHPSSPDQAGRLCVCGFLLSAFYLFAATEDVSRVCSSRTSLAPSIAKSSGVGLALNLQAACGPRSVADSNRDLLFHEYIARACL